MTHKDRISLPMESERVRDIEGIRVEFPFVPYDSQKDYLNVLVHALVHGRNAFLESPTGTGKTLCLLCGALAWQKAIALGQAPHPSQVQGSNALLWSNDALYGMRVSSLVPECLNSKDFSGDTFSEPSRSLIAWKGLSHIESGGIKQERSQQAPNSSRVDARERFSAKQGSRPTHTSVAPCSNRPSIVTPPTVFFASRTHSQLSQVVRELRKTAYVDAVRVTTQNHIGGATVTLEKNSEEGNSSEETAAFSPKSNFALRMTTVASRDHLCIHPELVQLKGAALNAGCQEKLKHHRCHYEGGLSRFKADQLTVPRDLEELRTFGRRAGFCPYYAAREHGAGCHLVLLPYEYLLCPVTRHQLKFNLRHSVIIFDEGHNVERVAEEAGSVDLNLSSVALAVQCLSEFVGRSNQLSADGFTKTDVTEKLIGPLLQLIQGIQNIHLRSSTSDIAIPHAVLPGPFFLDLLRECGFRCQNLSLYETITTRCCEWLASGDAAVEDDSGHPFVEKEPGAGRTDTSSHTTDVTAETQALERIAWALSLAFAIEEGQLRWYRSFVRDEPVDGKAGLIDARSKQKLSASKLRTAEEGPFPQSGRVLSFWCFSAGTVLHQLVVKERVHSLVITSGTLSPIASFMDALSGYGQLPFLSTLENRHVIPDNHVALHVVPRYVPPTEEKHSSANPAMNFRFTYQNRGNISMWKALGHVVLDITSRLVGSRVARDLVGWVYHGWRRLCRWKAVGLWDSLTRSRCVVTEPHSGPPDAFQAALNLYKTAVDAADQQGYRGTRKGAILLAVARGRVSEGFNFSDHLCRCVIVVGIPYPPLTDPRLQLKQKVLDMEFPCLNKGADWYQQQAARAVNQAIGRVVRHIHDYGVVVLVDERFNDTKQYNLLSRWIRNANSSQKKREDIGCYSSTIKGIEEFSKRMYCLERKLNLQSPRDFVKTEKEAIPPKRISTMVTELSSSDAYKVRRLQVMYQRKKALTAPSPLSMDRNLFRVTSTKKQPPVRELHRGQQLPFLPKLATATLGSLPEQACKSGPIKTCWSSEAQCSKPESKGSTPIETGEMARRYVQEVCGRCSKTYSRELFRKSLRCLHQACTACWIQQLQREQCCMFCSIRTRKEHLTRLE